MLAVERHQRIVELLESQGSCTNSVLARTLKVSLMTVRRDLEVLEGRGLLRRVHGGAQIAGDQDLGYSLRSRKRHEAKRSIGEAAARLVKPGETVFLDSGSTSMELARALRRSPPRGLRVVTHAVNIAAELSVHPAISVVQVGGEIYRQTYSATGPLAVDTIAGFGVDRFFLAAQGFGPDVGITNSNLPEVPVKAAAIQAARWTCLIADASKFGVASFARVAPMAAVQLVVSDGRLAAADRAAVEACGPTVLVAGDPGGSGK